MFDLLADFLYVKLDSKGVF